MLVHINLAKLTGCVYLCPHKEAAGLQDLMCCHENMQKMADHNCYFGLQHEREQKDPRGRTPLHLAVTLGHTKCAQLLVENGASCLAENRHQWNCVAEAICCGQPELLAAILSHHEHQLIQERSRTVPQLLDTLHTSPDFYIEMKWEFTSWGVSYNMTIFPPFC